MIVIQIPVFPVQVRNPGDGETHTRFRVSPNFWKLKHDNNDVLASTSSNEPGIITSSLFDDAFRYVYPDVTTDEEVFVELVADLPMQDAMTEDRAVVSGMK